MKIFFTSKLGKLHFLIDGTAFKVDDAFVNKSEDHLYLISLAKVCNLNLNLLFTEVHSCWHENDSNGTL